MDKSTHEKLLGYVVLALFSGTLFYLASSPTQNQSVSTSQVIVSNHESDQTKPGFTSEQTQQSLAQAESVPQDNDFSEYPPVPLTYTDPEPAKSSDQKMVLTEIKSDLSSENSNFQSVSPEKPQAKIETVDEISKQASDAAQQKASIKVIKKVKKPAAKTISTPAHFWSVQLGAFSTDAAAQSFAGQLQGIGLKKVHVSIKQNPHRYIVTAGQFDTVEQARGYKKFLEKDNIDGFIVKT